MNTFILQDIQSETLSYNNITKSLDITIRYELLIESYRITESTECIL